MAEKSLSDTEVFERSEIDHGDHVDIDRDDETGGSTGETGGNTGENGIDIICHRSTDNTTQLYGVKNYESLGKS